MASQDDLLNRITALVATFDDASWEALASKGLLRRARKALENGIQVRVTAEDPAALRIEVPPFMVSMPPSGPSKATCSCPAPGICQHILVAGLYLQSRSLTPGEKRVGATGDSIREEITSLTPELLKTWAGASDYRAGVALLEKNSSAPVIKYGDTIVVRLAPSGIEAHFVPGGGLDGMIVPKALGKRAAVAVILALRRSAGLDLPEAAIQQSLIEITGTPRTKGDILAAACKVLENAIMVGLSHASRVVVDRLVTLSVSAQGANLPRVSLALKSVADEVGSILEREARADEDRLLLLMSRTYALMEAIRYGGDNPRIELGGENRGQYVDVPEIELFGLGAWTWTTGSGYTGLTVLFWSNQSQEFLSWSDARPGSRQFDPRQRFHGEGPWDGAQSPKQVAASQVKLRNARRTAKGRLSSSTKTSALVLAPTSPQVLDCGARLFVSWEVLRGHLNQGQPIGLRDSNPLELIAIVEPAVFGPRSFDSINQTFSWKVYDEEDQELMLSLPFRHWSREAIRVLEELRPPEKSRWQVVVRVGFRDGDLWAEPISILRPENSECPVFQLAFDVLPQEPAPANSTVAPEIEDDEEVPDEEGTDVEDASVPGRIYLHSVVTELNRRLQAIAENGCQSGFQAHREWFEKSHVEVHASGLTCLAGVLESLTRSEHALPGVVLRARFLAHVHSQAAAHLVSE